MKMLRTVSAALLAGATLSAAPLPAQSVGSFSAPSGGSSGSAMGTGVAGSFRGDAGPGDRLDRPGRWDEGTWRDGRPERRERRERRWRREWYGYGIGIGSGSTLDPQGGYFAEGAEPPIVENGQAHYAYDRGYPYGHFRTAGRMNGARGEAGHGSAAQSCETAWTRERRTNQRVPVRVCRN